MSEVIAWSGFVGGWLLVAGPVYQAAIELADEDFERSDLEAAHASIDSPPRASGWWWLLPPVAYALRRRRARATRHALLHVLEPDQLERLMHFSETATAWLFVASGASLIATKETWDLHETYEWPTWVFWALTVVMVAFCASNTVVRVRRRRDILRQARAG